MCPDIVETKLLTQRQRLWEPDKHVIDKWAVLYNLQKDYVDRMKPKLDQMKSYDEVLGEKLKKEKADKENLSNLIQFQNKVNGDMKTKSENSNRFYNEDDSDDTNQSYSNSKTAATKKNGNRLSDFNKLLLKELNEEKSKQKKITSTNKEKLTETMKNFFKNNINNESINSDMSQIKTSYTNDNFQQGTNTPIFPNPYPQLNPMSDTQLGSPVYMPMNRPIPMPSPIINYNHVDQSLVMNPLPIQDPLIDFDKTIQNDDCNEENIITKKEIIVRKKITPENNVNNTCVNPVTQNNNTDSESLKNIFNNTTVNPKTNNTQVNTVIKKVKHKTHHKPATSNKNRTNKTRVVKTTKTILSKRNVAMSKNSTNSTNFHSDEEKSLKKSKETISDDSLKNKLESFLQQKESRILSDDDMFKLYLKLENNSHISSEEEPSEEILDSDEDPMEQINRKIVSPPQMSTFLETAEFVNYNKNLFETLINKSSNFNLETQRRGRRRSRFPDPQWDCAESQISKLVMYLCEEEVSFSYQKYCKPIFEQINTMVESFLYHDNNLEICQNLHMCPVTVDI